MTHGGRFRGEYLLRLVQLRALEFFEPGNLVQRHFREELEEAAHIGIFRVSPVLPVIIGAAHLRIEPDGAVRALAHLRARGCRQERARQAVEMRPVHAAGELDAVDDIAPLVGAAHLQRAVVIPLQFHEVVGLKDHVVEFQERQILLTVQPDLHAVEAEHAIDREVTAIVAQEIDIFQLVQPVAIIDHDGIGRPVAKGKELGEDLLDAVQIVVDLLIRQERARIVAKARIADAGRAAAHQGDRLVPGLLEPAQHHDLDEAADMKAFRRRIEADIARHSLLHGRLVEGGLVGKLMDETALREDAQEIGLVGCHCRARSVLVSDRVLREPWSCSMVSRDAKRT